MELKTGYKQTEVGVIPSDWEVKELKEVAKKIQTGPFGSQVHAYDYINEGIPIINPLNLLEGKIIADSTVGISASKANELSRHALINGDIVLARRGEMGRYGLVSAQEDGWMCGTGSLLIRVDKAKVNSEFVSMIFQTTIVKVWLSSNSVGTTMENINAQIASLLPLPIPPTLAEQTAIATALSDTDQYITHLEKLIAKKRNIKQGAMQELLKPKEGWVVSTYGEIFDFLTTATYSRADLSDTGEIGYVHYGDIHTKWSSFLDFEKYKLPAIVKNQLKNYPLLREGDIIMADASEDYSGVGESIEVKNLGDNKSISGLHTFLLRDKKGVFVNGFKGYIHKSKIVKSQIEKLASGLKVYGISKYNLKAVQVPIPPIEEQTRIATILSDMDTEITTLETKRSKAQSIKQGMMQQLLTGKIRLV
jgi:type I restriction enzyme S subunit